jgi:hypothetical protein
VQEGSSSKKETDTEGFATEIYQGREEVRQLTDLFSGKKDESGPGEDDESEKKVIYMSNINSCGMETPMDHQTLQHRGAEYASNPSQPSITSKVDEGQKQRVFEYNQPDHPMHTVVSDKPQDFSPAAYLHHEHADTDEIAEDRDIMTVK